MNHYPLIIFPQEVIKIYSSKPVTPKEPIKPTLKTDNSLEDAKGCSSFGLISIVLSIICAFSFSSVANDGDSRATFFYLALISFVMGIFSFFVSSSIKNGSVNSNTLKTHYETELNKYKTEHSNWLESKQQAESTEYVESWRVDQVEKFYQKMIKSFISTVDEDDK